MKQFLNNWNEMRLEFLTQFISVAAAEPWHPKYLVRVLIASVELSNLIVLFVAGKTEVRWTLFRIE